MSADHGPQNRLRPATTVLRPDYRVLKIQDQGIPQARTMTEVIDRTQQARSGMMTSEPWIVTPEKKICQLCDLETSDFPHFEEYGVGALDRVVLMETDHFQVKPDALPGPHDGRHVLIYPKDHKYNHAALTPLADELGWIMNELRDRMGDDYAVFEHGGSPHQQESKIQSVYHAHHHVYWGVEGVDIIRYMQDMLNGGLDGNTYEHRIVPAPDEAFLVNAAQHYNETPYLYIEQGSWGIWAPDTEDKFPSQITQRSMHQHFSGTTELNWKEIKNNDEYARLSIQRILSLINICQNGRHTHH